LIVTEDSWILKYFFSLFERPIQWYF
jgi:hypothetical protein